MAALFPRWANAAVRWGLLLGVVVILGSPFLLMGWVRTPWASGEGRAPEQPVPFDHRHHVADDGIDCRYCHYEVERSPYAGVPPTELCMNCHSQIWNDSPLLEPVRESYFTGEPLVWKRVYWLPDFVYFDHSAHVTNGVGCETCHGRVDRMARVFQKGPLTMGWCLSCHRDPAPNLRPLDQITTMGWTPDEPRAELGAKLAAEYNVRSLTNCTTCHR